VTDFQKTLLLLFCEATDGITEEMRIPGHVPTYEPVK